ncbi:metallophosphoesterase [Dactylosporangium vinaceum]|uniref:Metallophosphoesterase family protein n=1 Tax=Dactylosporangium vinaceum TaxID=53362 RepID=A0ABV5LY70_9ACTN|nr:metallophosphoesterase [Dactylosporangium vinaceum]UAC00976.1 metallophosphoesterase [Dactylosporangium vinaceum]
MNNSVFAVSDLHVSFGENRRIADEIRPESDGDWLIVAGDVADTFADVEWALRRLRARFAEVVWVPGNHELWTLPADPVQVRGEERYLALVDMCRGLGVRTPEDEFARWEGADGPVVIVPLFVLYDYSFRAPGTSTKQESLRAAYRARVVCTDEMFLPPDPYPDRESWCRARVAQTLPRLAALEPGVPTVLVSHWPLERCLTEPLRHPEFAQWCGTTLTGGWHRTYRAAAAVYGHLHIPGTRTVDGVRFEEVSLGYPKEWKARGDAPPLRRILGPA